MCCGFVVPVSGSIPTCAADDTHRQPFRLTLYESQVLRRKLLVRDLSTRRGIAAPRTRVDDQIPIVLIVLVSAAYDDGVRAFGARS